MGAYEANYVEGESAPFIRLCFTGELQGVSPLAETRGDSRTHMLQSTLAASQTLLPSDAVYACPFSGWTQGSVSKQALPHTVSVHICQVSEMRCGVCV